MAPPLLTRLPGPRFVPRTFGETMAEQDDLASLCANRDFVTRELFLPNAYYGNDMAVKAYADLPADYPLKIAMPHAVEAHTPPNVSRREAVPVTAFFAYGRDAIYRAMGVRHVWGMPSPYALTAEMCSRDPAPERAGTLFFPTHSGVGVRVQYDIEQIADRVLALPPEYHPITVCIFWVDYLYGLHRPFEERGMRVVSAGHQADPQFLPRFFHLCRAHEFAASNDAGTHVFYAVKAGCRYFHVDGPAEWDLDGFIQPDDDPAHLGVRTLFREFEHWPHEEQLRIVDRYLGTRFLRPPGELARMLWEAELLDKVGFARLRAAGNGDLAVTGPWFLRRRVRGALKTLVQRLRGALRRGDPPSPTSDGPARDPGVVRPPRRRAVRA